MALGICDLSVVGKYWCLQRCVCLRFAELEKTCVPVSSGLASAGTCAHSVVGPDVMSGHSPPLPVALQHLPCLLWSERINREHTLGCSPCLTFSFLFPVDLFIYCVHCVGFQEVHKLLVKDRE